MNIKDDNFFFGLNVLHDVVNKAVVDFKIDTIDCMAYNVSLDYVSSILKKYPSIKKINIYSNTENISYQDEHWVEINESIKSGKIRFFHLSSNRTIIHAKIYRFLKEDQLILGAIGSSNFSKNSNQSLEFLYVIDDIRALENIWETIKTFFKEYKLSCLKTPPVHVLIGKDPVEQIDSAVLKETWGNLWAHQKGILKWMIKKNQMIINIPPGCGKTRLTLIYMKILLEQFPDITFIILVPTKTLIEQWLVQLKNEQIISFEGDSGWRNNDVYFGNPKKRALVTLYNPRFFKDSKSLIDNLEIMKPKLCVISDECHNLYSNLTAYQSFVSEYKLIVNNQVYEMGLSATIDSFNVDEMSSYIEHMGGESNRYEISLQSFYSQWNDKNKTKILKNLRYSPIKYRLTSDEMDEYSEFSKKIAQQYFMTNINGEKNFSAAIERARWVRSLPGGIIAFKKYLDLNFKDFFEGSTIIFVQTHDIAKQIREFIVQHPSWDIHASAYIYDSNQSEKFKEYAMEDFKNNKGFCLIAEKMLSEGLDIPKINRIILHGSDKSERDWIQKVGRALRFDKNDPTSIANVIDIVFCNPGGIPLPIEEERFNVLNSVSTE